MSSVVSSVNLSILSFALTSWLDGSAQLRRSLILFPLDLGNNTLDAEPSELTVEDSDPSAVPARVRFIERCISWFKRPDKDLDEVEKSILGLLDVSSSVLLLKLLGSGPILPFLLNPLSITLALPRKLSVGSVKWSRVVTICLLLSALHEAQRVSVAAGIAWLRMKKPDNHTANIGKVIVRGKKLERTNEDEDEESCVICTGGHSDAPPLSDSISSISSLSTPQGNTPDPGPLEAFCVHAPNKHPMHRACFLAWKDAYWEARASRPIITLTSDDRAVPLPGTWQWKRTQAVVSAIGSRIYQMTYFIPLSPAELSQSTGINRIGETVFTLRSADTAEDERGSVDSTELGNMVSGWPPCPWCRSSVRMIFARAKPSRGSDASRAGHGLIYRFIHVWLRSWKKLVTGRTILVKMSTQVLFALFLVSMMRIRKSRAR